ncbi:DUF1572 domain-containing protein [Fluviicola sp.]|uniref:DUF1572 domain-containing protein n=1 Tax=Fluviicola sp. TaxID=1917219 RepID=UPI0031E01593
MDKTNQKQLSGQLAKHLRDVHFGGTWTTVDLKATLSDVSWEEAKMSMYGIHSIAALMFHMSYYLGVMITVLEEGKLVGKDELSWILPPIESQDAWEQLQLNIWKEAEKTANLVENLPDEALTAGFVDPKYGTNYRNIAGMIEHMHYHLGQIVLIKKLIRQA